ncbi:indole-3-glycerol-phosphate synthase [Streptomyces sp. WAC05374]|uniref:indole-3-glycerol-phosphate synthase n=1 Tax=Streptomyces sp. WAC05374 TaxID=2487420 RepID=UPI000F863586|nr:indole-3-glycerol-phosphate synthase [Streptomyces sp. WAC05374]RST15760.1 indole-3-glycerol-phosphate synthase [Streptomyces sp. WAC05374]TDF39070.1 indole-3-glycerol-phosphate synthase [Streptomyces sp. WAC05374]TDF47507.1 indole-3-glycerol-phosphate synthase [Streptomyces sp. WAC05374]TDF48178.1 indole-3-glycerol-phosphate synthase [Streptomyces sp. WAC05374]
MTSRFIEALLTAERPLIMEIKRRDAHGIDLIAGRTPADIVAAYEAAGAPCVSVVTGRWFGGTPDLLRDVARLTDLPLLQKDFITRRDQLTTAGELGASAVLLTAALLPVSALRTLVEAALRTGLTPFVEVTCEAEVAAVPHAADCVIAVNNKDIRTRERDAGDIGRSLALLPALQAAGTPCPVSASAIDTPVTATRLLDAGYRGLLIGTALLRAADPLTWPTAAPVG